MAPVGQLPDRRSTPAVLISPSSDIIPNSLPHVPNKGEPEPEPLRGCRTVGWRVDAHSEGAAPQVSLSRSTAKLRLPHEYPLLRRMAALTNAVSVTRSARCNPAVASPGAPSVAPVAPREATHTPPLGPPLRATWAPPRDRPHGPPAHHPGDRPRRRPPWPPRRAHPVGPYAWPPGAIRPLGGPDLAGGRRPTAGPPDRQPARDRWLAGDRLSARRTAARVARLQGPHAPRAA